MLTTTGRGSVVDAYGVRHEIIPGVTRWATDCAELADPEVAALFGRAQSTRSRERARSEEPRHESLPTWALRRDERCPWRL
jgi:hypothetical protein